MMSHHAPVRLPPARADLSVSRASLRIAKPPVERVLRAITELADEKTVVSAATLFWLYTSLRKQDEIVARQADHMLACVLVADALPRITKLLFARERPDRTLARSRRRGIKRTGEPWDSFPSGHAILLGVLGEPLRRLAPKPLRPFVWPAMIGLASTRVLLLAHYLSDVVAGLGIGFAAQRLIRRFHADPQK
jgi:membrane-associated phospholipid phosphatase